MSHEKTVCLIPLPLYLLAVRPKIKFPGNLFRLHYIDKGIRIHPANHANDFLALRAGNNRIDKLSLAALIGSHCIHDRSAMMGNLGDRPINLPWPVGHNDQRMLLIFLIHHVKYLGRSILKNDGI